MEESFQTLQGENVRWFYLLLVVLGIVVFTVAAKANWNKLSLTPNKARIKEWFGIVTGAFLLHIIWRESHPDLYAMLSSNNLFWLAHVAVVWSYALSEVSPNSRPLRWIRRSVLTASISGLVFIIGPVLWKKVEGPRENDMIESYRSRGIIVFEPEYVGWTDSLFVLNSVDTMLIVNVRRPGYGYRWRGDGTKFQWIQRMYDGNPRGSFILKPPTDSVHLLISIAPQDEITKASSPQKIERSWAPTRQKSQAELIRERITADSLEAIRDSLNRVRDRIRDAERRRERDSLNLVWQMKRDSQNLTYERRSDSIRRVRERYSDSVRRAREEESRNRRRRP